MNLPLISLPIEVPETLPLLLHPAVVHFAVVLPLVILIIELINLFTKRKALSVSVYALFVLLMAVYVAAYMTGVTDAREAGLLLTDEGVAELKAHKLLGIYLIYFSLLPLVLKVLSFFVHKGWSRALYSLALAVLVAFTFYQGKEGGELVYGYGANVSSQAALGDRVEELEDALDELKSSYEEQIATLIADNNLSLQETNSTVSMPETADLNSSKTEPVDMNITAAPLKADVNSSAERKANDTNRSK